MLPLAFECLGANSYPALSSFPSLYLSAVDETNAWTLSMPNAVLTVTDPVAGAMVRWRRVCRLGRRTSETQCSEKATVKSGGLSPRDVESCPLSSRHCAR